jgi:hypothetical protein
MNQDQLIIQSPERLVHFQCPICKGWWSIGDAPERAFWFCPWCGKKGLTKGGPVSVATGETPPLTYQQKPAPEWVEPEKGATEYE